MFATSFSSSTSQSSTTTTTNGTSHLIFPLKITNIFIQHGSNRTVEYTSLDTAIITMVILQTIIPSLVTGKSTRTARFLRRDRFVLRCWIGSGCQSWGLGRHVCGGSTAGVDITCKVGRPVPILDRFVKEHIVRTGAN
jgi:hypothetical protein